LNQCGRLFAGLSRLSFFNYTAAHHGFGQTEELKVERQKGLTFWKSGTSEVVHTGVDGAAKAREAIVMAVG
jgi:hypothetical protein